MHFPLLINVSAKWCRNLAISSRLPFTEFSKRSAYPIMPRSFLVYSNASKQLNELTTYPDLLYKSFAINKLLNLCRRPIKIKGKATGLIIVHINRPRIKSKSKFMFLIIFVNIRTTNHGEDNYLIFLTPCFQLYWVDDTNVHTYMYRSCRTKLVL